MNQSTVLANALAEKMQDIRNTKGQAISIQDISELLDQVLEHSQPNSISGDVRGELEAMLNRLGDTKSDVEQLLEQSDEAQSLATASSALGIIVEATEEATNRILDATEAIQAIAGSLDGDTSQKIMDQTMEIFEACNFQDLTGQRVSNVISTLEFIEEHLQNLTGLLGYGESIGAQSPRAKKAKSSGPKAIEDITDDELMNGPQNPDEAPSQDEIDDLFNSL